MQKSPVRQLRVVAAAALVGCVLAFIGGRWITAGRIEYWTGPTERHHFLATPHSSPVIYWILVLVFCVGAIALWTKSIVDVIRWMLSPLNSKHDAPADQSPASSSSRP